MKTATIRQKFINFFQSKGHTFIPPAPIVQHDNPSLLFVNAGMNPFTPILLGNQPAPTPRATNSQPCLRVTGKHNDLEEVGGDTYHHTFFEMLGSWSFGDYFKQQAIAYAWELLTDVYGLPKERLYVTVFQGDQRDGTKLDKKTWDHWQSYLPPERILYASKKDNFWEMGATGPCGPCTEIHIDLRSDEQRQKVEGSTLVNGDHPQVIELWNLVFIQYHRQADGTLSPLPTCHVDTGMGLERLAMVLQGKQATYDTDAFQPLLAAMATQAGVVYGQDPIQDVALRVAADHIRAISFAIAGGALPSNQQAGYVVRRLLRRAVRYAYQHLDIKTPSLHTLVPVLVESMGEAYPSLSKQQALLQKVVHEEEHHFLRTLAHGLRHFAHARTLAKEKQIEGATAFQLYDTYGFPIDLTKLIAQEEGMTVDIDGFDKEMKAQKQRSKQAGAKAYGDWHQVRGAVRTTTFVGYDQLETHSQLLAYRTVAKQGTTLYQLILNQTPFYPEGGGQVGDTGLLQTSHEKIAVLDTKKEDGVIVHYTKALPSELEAPLQAVVHASRRKLTANNHTATHLLEAALRHTLGTHISQRGSYLDHERLRFDFSHPEKLTQAECHAIEALVNEKIRANIPRVEERKVPLQEAKQRGARTLLGESYSDTVRVITFDPTYSIALCGGTHVPSTGHIGFFKIIAETSVASGIRRIEALTALAAEQWVRQTQTELTAIRVLLKNPQNTLSSLQALQKGHKEAQKEVAAYQHRDMQHAKQTIEAQIQAVGQHHVGVAHVVTRTVQDLRKAMTLLEKSHHPLVLVVTTVIAHRAYIASVVSSDLAAQYDASQIIHQLAPYIQGKGGGKSTFAMAQGKHLAGLENVAMQAQKMLSIPNRK